MHTLVYGRKNLKFQKLLKVLIKKNIQRVSTFIRAL